MVVVLLALLAAPAGAQAAQGAASAASAPGAQGTESAADPGSAPGVQSTHPPQDPTSYLGMDLARAVATLGLPRDIFAWRGADAASDNVVFYYPDSLYLFWFRDRVWQVRYDRRFSGPVLGLTLGMSRDEVIQASARSYIASGNSLYYDIDGAGFPVRVRLVFDAGRLTDMYVYRSDY
jgi:hypothetical protein